MTARMIVIGLVSLFLSSIPLTYSDERPPTTPAHIQQPQSIHTTTKTWRIFIEEDFSTAQMVKRDLTYWSGRFGIPVIFVEKDVEPYDLRILLASAVGSGSDS